MALLKRLSESFWSYVSPQKPPATFALPTPQTEARFQRPALRDGRGSADDVAKGARSMSPLERVGAWDVRSPSSDLDAARTGSKRKGFLTITSPHDIARRPKLPRLSAGDVTEESAHLDELDGDTLVQDEEIEAGDFGSDPFVEGDMSVENTLVVDEDGDALAHSKSRIISLPEEHDMRHVSTEELRSQGWDDDYIILMQKIAMRGYEPLLPAHWKFDYRMFLPDGLFEEHDDAFIGSVRGDHFRGSKALERLFELGGRVRDRVYLDGAVEPQEQVYRQLTDYIKWAQQDAGLDLDSAIPILAMELQPAQTPAATLRANATRRCARLAARYREALRVERSVEVPSPSSHSTNRTLLSYPLPTFYAIVASYTVVAVMAYNPNDETPEARPMAFFDFSNVVYDVWNSLALAITVCHVRNVQMRIAEDTGLGARQSSYSEEDDDDDDDDDVDEDDDPDA